MSDTKILQEISFTSYVRTIHAPRATHIACTIHIILVPRATTRSRTLATSNRLRIGQQPAVHAPKTWDNSQSEFFHIQYEKYLCVCACKEYDK